MEEPTQAEDPRPEEAPAPVPAVWPPPPTIAPPTMAGSVPPAFLFLPILRLSRAMIVLLSLCAGLSLLGFGGALLSLPPATRQMEVGIVNLGQALLLLATGVCFLIWMYRLDRNLRAFGVEGLRYAPGWAVAFFFIPVMSLYRPYLVFREIWQASDPAPAARAGQAWRKTRTPPLLGVWWASFLLMNIVDALSSSSPVATDIDAVDNAVGFFSALLALQVVRLFTARQEKTANLLALGG